MTRPLLLTGRIEMERRVVRRAQTDPEWRELLMSDPHAALTEEFGTDLPTNLEIQVVQERPDMMCVVLPVDLSGMAFDAVWAMYGFRPEVDA